MCEIAGNALLVHLDLFRQDAGYTLRILRRSPGFASTAILVIALGIGATTAAFSVTDFVLLRPLPFPDSDRLVKVWERTPGYRRLELSPANYRDCKAAATVFDSIGTYHSAAANLVGAGEPQRVEGAAVSYDLFPTLGVRPLIGRMFSAADDREGAPGTALLSYRLWQTQFGGDAGIVGHQVLLDDGSYTIIGVMPREFRFPSAESQMWVPLRFTEANYADRGDNWIYAVARLRAGVTLDQARAEMDVIAARLQRQYPKSLASALGRRFTFAFSERVVAGIVGDVRLRGLERDVHEPQVYLPYRQVKDGWIIGYIPRALVVRASTPPERLASSVRAILHRVDPTLPISEIATLTEVVERDTSSRAVQVRVIAAFAFVLAAIGIHGLLSFAVSQRVQEIGVRIAVGAQPGDILSMVVRRSILLAASGIVPGMALAYAAGRSMEALLAGVKPADVPTMAGAVALAMVMTIAGSVAPTLRALRVDPITALRAE